MKKLLYVAANPESMPPIRLDAEISAIQSQLLTQVDADDRLETVFLPDLDALSLEQALRREQPDILHIAAHGAGNGLVIKQAGSSNSWGALDASTLNAWLPNPAPRLVYINACDSQSFAKQLVGFGKVAIAIATDAEIQNLAARTAAVTFYSRIISGGSIQDAFEACKRMALFQQKSVNMVIEASGADASRAVLHQKPSLVARFLDHPPRRRDKGSFVFQIGVIACPPQTSQVVFFTDEEGFARKRPDDLENALSTIIRGTAMKEEFWIPPVPRLCWWSREESRIFAVGVNPAGDIFAIRGTYLSAALERYYLITNGGVVPNDIRDALSEFLTGQQFQGLFAGGRLLRSEEDPSPKVPVPRPRTRLFQPIVVDETAILDALRQFGTRWPTAEIEWPEAANELLTILRQVLSSDLQALPGVDGPKYQNDLAGALARASDGRVNACRKLSEMVGRLRDYAKPLQIAAIKGFLLIANYEVHEEVVYHATWKPLIDLVDLSPAKAMHDMHADQGLRKIFGTRDEPIDRVEVSKLGEELVYHAGGDRGGVWIALPRKMAERARRSNLPLSDICQWVLPQLEFAAIKSKPEVYSTVAFGRIRREEGETC